METLITEDEIYYCEPVPEDKEGLRLDKWLSLAVPSESRTRIAHLINAGKVSKDGHVCNFSSVRVKAGEEYVFAVPPPKELNVLPEKIPLNILFEDEDLIVINKPAGMVVHPGAGNWEHTMVNALLAHCKGSLSGIGGVERPGIVHRIDKDTSGVLVVAKTDFAHRALANMFRAHDIERIYTAIVWGVPTPLKGTVAGQIGRSKTNRQKMAILHEGGRGREAITHYQVIKVLADGAASLIECRLETGRTHQIRVHMTSIGCPLIGDKTYTENRPNKKPMGEQRRAAAEAFPRQALHAGVLGFTHPRTGEHLRFEAKLPVDMTALLETLSSP